jgi:hypothetical protein
LDEDEVARRKRAEQLRKRVKGLLDEGERPPPTTPRELADRAADEARGAALARDSGRVAPAEFPAMGFDTGTVLNDASATALHAAGMRFALRYLGTLDAAEVGSVLRSGLALMPVALGRAPGWKPSRELGRADGRQAIEHAAIAALPPGVTVWCKLEECSGTEQGTFAYVEAWTGVLRTAGFDPGLYVGPRQALHGSELDALGIDRYWRSSSQVPEPTCGWCLLQLHKTTRVAGVTVDVDVVQYDYRARLPNWVVR